MRDGSFSASSCKTALTVVGGYVVAINPAAATEDAGEAEGDVGPLEDLMREHGVMRRVLLVYEEGLRRIAAHQDFPGNPFLTGAQLIRKFIEDYHEKNEEKFIFPKLRNNAGEAGTRRSDSSRAASGRAQTHR